MAGKSEFKVKINRLGIAEITQKAGIPLNEQTQAFLQSAPLEDIETAAVLQALSTYLEERRCAPDFEVVLSE